MKIEIKDANGATKEVILKEITIEDFLKIPVLKHDLSYGKYANLIQVHTKESELHLDVVDAIAYITVFVSENAIKELGFEGDILKQSLKKSGILRKIGKQIEAYYLELLNEYKEVEISK
jgi:hypothetical protein